MASHCSRNVLGRRRSATVDGMTVMGAIFPVPCQAPYP